VRNLESTVRSSGPLRRLLLLWVCLLALGVAGAVHAAPQFDVFLGYDSLVPEASWFPVVCEIKNDGPPFKGRIEISEGRFDQGQSRYAEVELPTSTLKRVVIPVFSAARSMRSWDVRLLDERGKVRAEQLNVPSRKDIPAGTPIMGALTRTMSSVPAFAMPQNRDLQPLAARILPEIFPDNPLVLEGLTCIYLSSEKAPLLTDNQARALLAWLNGGGHLIVGVEQTTDLSATRWLNSVLPFMPREMKSVAQHRELQDWLRSATWRTNVAVSTGVVPPPNVYNGRYNSPRPRRSAPSAAVPLDGAAVNPFSDLPDDFNFEAAEMLVATGKLLDGQVVVAAGDTPLIVTANRGRGRVTQLLFSPEREPFKTWKNQPTFWSKLIDVPGVWYAQGVNVPTGGTSSDGIFKAMIDTRQIHQLPVAWLLLLLVVYLVVIGPLDQFWLKRIGRPMLTWITFPCYVVAFSLVIYLIGYKLRAGESEWNELHLVDLLGNADHAELRGRTYMSVYSPANQRYPLESPQQLATFRSEFAGWNRQQSNEKATVLQNGDSFRAEIFVPVWTSQLFVSDWWHAMSAPLVATVTAQSDGWQVRIDNHTDSQLTDTKLVVEDRILTLGAVPAGATKTFTVTRSQALSLSEFVHGHAQGFYQAVQQHGAAFGNTQGGWITDLPNTTVAASFLSRLDQSQNNNYYSRFISPPGLDMCAVLDHGSAVLFAWAGDYSPVKSIRQFTPKRSHRDTLFRVVLPVK
jgi:hypothetical protein